LLAASCLCSQPSVVLYAFFVVICCRPHMPPVLVPCLPPRHRRCCRRLGSSCSCLPTRWLPLRLLWTRARICHLALLRASFPPWQVRRALLCALPQPPLLLPAIF
jgi:hypothetical protein